MSGSFWGLGRVSTRMPMFTDCRSLLPDTLWIVTGLARTSYMMGRSNQGTMKCMPSS